MVYSGCIDCSSPIRHVYVVVVGGGAVAVAVVLINVLISGSITGQHSNRKQLWCANIGEYMVLGSIAGSDYLQHDPL